MEEPFLEAEGFTNDLNDMLMMSVPQDLLSSNKRVSDYNSIVVAPKEGSGETDRTSTYERGTQKCTRRETHIDIRLEEKKVSCGQTTSSRVGVNWSNN